ncbi:MULTISPECIES: helix-turn-helix transcriptional regulator [Paracoccus]|uniref:helix-turn-helix domain-containing protein n=1 Tax=Paracoccus TaxID=265 RepID=UPI0023F22EC6|nr:MULTISPECIES: helix-turn-helix transcriptional regulator [Paracoccus]
MGNDAPTPEGERPKHLTKQEFGRRVYRLMTERGWHQSELARQAQLTRDAVSTYVNGRSLPDPRNAQKLADAFGMTVEQLLPNLVEQSIDRDPPAMELKVSALNPNVAWLRLNRLVETENAMKIMSILREDNAASSDGS